MAFLIAYHDEIEHWDTRATRTLIVDRFLWPTIYKDIHKYVKSCDDFQRMARIPKYYSGSRASLKSLFDVFLIDSTGPLPTTLCENKNLLVCVEYVTGWPVARPTPTDTASEVNYFVKEHMFMRFGRPRLFV